MAPDATMPGQQPPRSGGSVRRDAMRSMIRAGRSFVTGRPMAKPKAAAGPADPLPGALRDEAMASLRALGPFAGTPIVLAEFPRVSTNPIQALLLGRARVHGVAPVEVRSLGQLEELLELRQHGIAVALHLHWLEPVTRGAQSEDEAASRVDAFLARVEVLRSAGVSIVWTVHNILPHASKFESHEARLAAGVAARADVVHVMAERTAELTAPWYSLPPDRILHVPHPSYAGVYPDYLSRLDARHRLGILPDEFTFLALGAIQAYKGLSDLLDAWSRRPAAGRRLVVAGIAADDATVGETLSRASRDATVLVRVGKIAVQDMQVYLRAADVAVLPYRGALNSGALLLALTFGLPVIVPAGTGLADLVEPTFAIAYGEPGPGLVEALDQAPGLASATARAAALKAAALVHPADVSERFVTGLRARLGMPAT